MLDICSLHTIGQAHINPKICLSNGSGRAVHAHHPLDKKSVYMVLMPLCAASVKEKPWGFLSLSYNTASGCLPYILLFTCSEFLPFQPEPIPQLCYLGVPVHTNLDFGKAPANVQVCSFALLWLSFLLTKKLVRSFPCGIAGYTLTWDAKSQVRLYSTTTRMPKHVDCTQKYIFLPPKRVSFTVV